MQNWFLTNHMSSIKRLKHIIAEKVAFFYVVFFHICSCLNFSSLFLACLTEKVLGFLNLYRVIYKAGLGILCVSIYIKGVSFVFDEFFDVVFYGVGIT